MNAINILTVLQLRIDENEIITITNDTRFCAITLCVSWFCLDKAPRLSISIVIWILSSDTFCQLNQFHTNSEAAMLFINNINILFVCVNLQNGSIQV